MKTTFIYTLEDQYGNIRYIGKSNNPIKRLSNHLSDKTNLHKKNWINSLLKEKTKPIVNIIDEVSTKEWQYWEKYWISQFKCWGFNLLNATNGGDGPETYTQVGEYNGFYGKNHTKESKLKMRSAKLGTKIINRKQLNDVQRKNISESKKGNSYKKGFKTSEETKLKISNSLKGNKLSEETKLKISNSQKGREKSKEHIQKIAEKNKGKKRNEEQIKRLKESHIGQESSNKIKIKAFDFKTNEYVGTYDSYTECGEKLNIDFRKISLVVKGKRNHTGGYTFIKINI